MLQKTVEEIHLMKNIRTGIKPIHILAFMFLLVFTTAPASADLIDSISLLAPGSKYRVAFVTSGTRDATSTDINDYDQFVQSAADTGAVTQPLALNWQAMGSTATIAARDHLNAPQTDTGTVVIFNTIGQTIADSYADLWDGVISAPIKYTEAGSAISNSVWTGSNLFGEAEPSYQLGTDTPVTGRSNRSDYEWFAERIQSNGLVYSLFGLSEEITTASAAPIPEPATVFLFGIGLLGLAGVTKRKTS
jgi:hypothetical protein